MTSASSSPPTGDESPNPPTDQQRKGGVVRVALAAVLLWVAVSLYLGQGFWRPPKEEAPPPPSIEFDLTESSIPREAIHAGGPPKDGIPALSHPNMVSAHDTHYYDPPDRVIGVFLEGESRAYPLKILNYHEIVNDQIGETPFAITYCPLCDSAAVFQRQTSLGIHEFGVSGLLYNSNVLMFDRGGSPESLWSQVKGAGVSGPANGISLKTLPVELTTWKSWLSRYPDTKVLSLDTGTPRNYARNPYAEYMRAPGLVSPVAPRNDRLAVKEVVLGVWTDGVSRAYPVSALGPKRPSIVDELAGRKIKIAWDPLSRGLRVLEADEGVQWMYSFWFAWYAFREDTEVFGQDE